jgi:hypothetical protein
VVIANVGSKEGKVTVSVVTAPAVTVTGPASATVGLPANYVITPAAAGATGSPIQNVTVDFGDGSSQNLGAITSATTVSHAYNSPGSFTIVATATDQTGQRGTGSFTVNVQRVLPTILFTTCPATANAGQPAAFTVTPPANPTFPIQNVTVDFGDGTSRNLGQITGPTSFTKAFDSPGGYTVTATVTDTSGQRGTSSCAVIVGRAGSPTVQTAKVLPGNAKAGRVDAYTVTATAAAGGPPIVNVRVTLQDGTVLYNASGSGSFTWTPASAGTAVLTSVATDAAGNQGNHILVLTVDP